MHDNERPSELNDIKGGYKIHLNKYLYVVLGILSIIIVLCACSKLRRMN